MRLFIAVDFNDEILDMLRNCQRQLQAQVRSASLTAEENLHLTLAFSVKRKNRAEPYRP